jgi:hypothetical protein
MILKSAMIQKRYTKNFHKMLNLIKPKISFFKRMGQIFCGVKRGSPGMDKESSRIGVFFACINSVLNAYGSTPSLPQWLPEKYSIVPYFFLSFHTAKTIVSIIRHRHNKTFFIALSNLK